MKARARVRIVVAPPPTQRLARNAPDNLLRTDHGPADDGSVTADILGQGQHDDIGPQFKWSEQASRAQGIIDNQGYLFGSNYRFSTVVRNLRRFENRFHRSQFFKLNVTIDAMVLR